MDNIKTIVSTDNVNVVDFDGSEKRFYWFRNLGDSTLYVSAKPNPIAGGDDVSELPPKSSTSIETDTGKIYILGAGKVEIHNTDSKFCPFKGVIVVSGGGGGGEPTGYISDGLICFSDLTDEIVYNPAADSKLGHDVNNCDSTNGYYQGSNTNIVGQMSAEFTLQVLIKTTSTSAFVFGVIYDSPYRTAQLTIEDGGYLGLERASGHITTDVLVNDDEWHMLAAAYDGSVMRLYADGIKALEIDHTWDIPSNAVICVGQWRTGTGKYVGSIANACIYNRALSDDEIAQNWQTDIRRYGISN